MSINILQSDERIKLKTWGRSCQWRKSQLQNGREDLVVNNLKRGDKDVPVLFDRAVKTKNKTLACSTSPQELSCRSFIAAPQFLDMSPQMHPKSLCTHLKALNSSFKQQFQTFQHSKSLQNTIIKRPVTQNPPNSFSETAVNGLFGRSGADVFTTNRKC